MNLKIIIIEHFKELIAGITVALTVAFKKKIQKLLTTPILKPKTEFYLFASHISNRFKNIDIDAIFEIASDTQLDKALSLANANHVAIVNLKFNGISVIDTLIEKSLSNNRLNINSRDAEPLKTFINELAYKQTSNEIWIMNEDNNDNPFYKLVTTLTDNKVFVLIPMFKDQNNHIFTFVGYSENTKFDKNKTDAIRTVLLNIAHLNFFLS